MDNIASGEILSFIDLLEKNKIEIPIIQRDYAQGRSENKDIRRDFLQALKDSIVNCKKIKLDFIYGEVIDDTFQPLDGQQRLTTLFLLHWYAIAKEGEIPKDLIDLLSKFTYETRISSRDFCNNLVEKSIPMVKNEKLSEQIKDANWFYLSWKQDPSISAMLTTLDDINNEFGDVDNLWELLTRQKLITFHHLNLQDLGLSDDLYIKMNARGKLLTPFENFKAQLQKLIEEKDWEKGYDPREKFEFKIDTKWTDFFWTKYNERVDIAHIKFISAIIMNRVALDKSVISSATRHSNIQQLNDNNDGRYLLKFINKNVYQYIYDCYEIFCELNLDNINTSINDIKFWNHNCKGGSILDQVVSEPSSYTQKALLYAQTEYLMRNENFDRNSYMNWMRVVRNFVCYADIAIIGNKRADLLRAPEAFNSMIGLINILADGCNNIYQYLIDFNANSISYRKDQMKEEIDKAKIIIENPELKDIIWKLEDLNLFRGRISFVFECMNELYGEDAFKKEQLEDLYNIFSRYFDNESIPHDFNRAMLTVSVNGEYEFYNYWWSYWYAGNATKRKFISKLNELEYYIYSDCKSYFLSLVLALLENDYESIINNFIPPDDMPDWKIKLIKDNSLIKNKPSDFFAITEDNLNCYLLKSQKPQSLDGGIPI